MPINKVQYPMRSRFPEHTVLLATFTGAGTSAPTLTDGRGDWQVTRTGLGVYEVTVPGRGERDIRGVTATIEEASPTPLFPLLTTMTKATGVIEITVLSGALAATDLTTSEKLYLRVDVKNSKGR